MSFALARSGPDADLVTTVYRRYYASLCRTARLLVDDPGRAEELVQDAFTRTLAGRRALRDPALTHAYLQRAVVHGCHSELRRRRVERRVGAGDRGAPIASADQVPATGQFADQVGDRDAVVRLLGNLPPRQREAVVLRYFADLDVAAVADAMRCSVGTVKSQIAKAKRHLSALVETRQEPR